jgi:hypothetical protein
LANLIRFCVAYYIAFGPHGPRADAPPGETKRILTGVALALIASGVVFGAIRHFAGPAPKTMTKEWQEATNKYMQVCYYSGLQTQQMEILALCCMINKLRVKFANACPPLQEEHIEPITGPGQEGYTGKGMIQSPSGGKSLDDDEEE